MIGSGSTSFAKALTVTFTNSATTTATIDLSYTAVNIPARVTTTTLSFSKAAPTTKVINYTLGSGSSAKTKITAIYVDGKIGGALTPLDLVAQEAGAHVTITGTTITIDNLWFSYYDLGTANIFVSFDGAAKGATPDCVMTVTN